MTYSVLKVPLNPNQPTEMLLSRGFIVFLYITPIFAHLPRPNCKTDFCTFWFKDASPRLLRSWGQNCKSFRFSYCTQKGT